MLRSMQKMLRNIATSFSFFTQLKKLKKLNKERNKKLCCNMLLEQIELIRARTYQHRLF